MSYKIGDKVRIKSTDWYNKNKDKHGIVICGMMPFCGYMSCRCGTIVTISEILEWGYCIEEDCGENGWTDEMIEGLVEEENKSNIIEEAKTYWDSIKDAWICPDGYIFKDENGNVINATKIVLEKKKKEYPKIFEECVHVLEGDSRMSLEQMNTFRRLIDARNAYWKIAGDWKPDYDSGGDKFGIVCYDGIVTKTSAVQHWERHLNKVLDFPTAEMRDAFYEAFQKEIEICKELL